MRALRNSLPLIVAVALWGQAGVALADAHVAGVGGRVTGQSSPLSSVRIWAYQLADLSLKQRASTDGQGNFLLKDLPVGPYKIIAHKVGFVPLVVMLTRTAADAYQTVELQLSQQKPVAGIPGDDFWAVRSRVPADVLREIETAEIEASSFTVGVGSAVSIPGNFQAEMQALTGVDEVASVGGQLSGGGVGIKGQLGGTQVDLKGRFMQLSGAAFQPQSGAGLGQTSSLSLDLNRGHGSRINISSLNNRLARGESGEAPIAFENYQLNYSQDVGQNGRFDSTAQYSAEDNLHRQTLIDPADIPQTSRTWRIEGAYTLQFSDSSSLQTGLRYRERQFGLGNAPAGQGKNAETQVLSSIDLFSRGGVRVQPAVLMEYGLYSTLSDGSVALTPQGGFVLQLGPNWQLESTAARRVYTNAQANPDFLPSLFEQRDLCEQGSEACYQVNLSRKVGDDDAFTFGAVHRRVGDTLRLYFSDDFFDRLESLYLVRGDQLPELHTSFQHKVSPRVVTKFDSSVAAGGGGTFLAADGRPWENQVRYLVTSLDTQFLGSSTGVFVSFHRLQQQLDPANGAPGASAQMEYERLQLMLTQNLNFLLNLASDWAVQLNMELSRGGAVANSHDPDSVRRRILGGIAVKF